MGKGEGCFPSKNNAHLLGKTNKPDEQPPKTSSDPKPDVEPPETSSDPKPDVQPPKTSSDPKPDVQPPNTSSDPKPDDVQAPKGIEITTPEIDKKKLKIFIIFYSMYGHVESLAKKMKKGVDEISGVEGFLYRVVETLPSGVLEKMHAPPKDTGIPEISAKELEEADGFLFGFPTRFGAMAAQMKALFDSTGGLWTQQALAGKPAGFFFGTASQGSGQETTAWTAITQLTHHGMLFVPIGYTFGAEMFDMSSVRGGSPYGAGTFSAGDGTRLPTQAELALAEHQGKYMAGVVNKLCA